MDERYIRQLKAEILYVSQLNHEKGISLKALRGIPHNHHIKNLHSIRENKLSGSTAESIQAQLVRYSHSSDPVQVSELLQAVLGKLYDMSRLTNSPFM